MIGIGTEIFQFGSKEAEIIEFKEGWGKKSLSQPNSNPISLNPNFSVIFSDIHKVPVLISKLMTRQFQNTPYT